MKSLRLVNFKAFEDRTFDLKPLTLLSGANNTGKSCLLQSILLLRQSYQQRLLPTRGLALNGNLVAIGTGRDALNECAQTDSIGFEITGDDRSRSIWQFQYERDADVLSLISPPVIESVHATNIFNDEFHYLSSCVDDQRLLGSFAWSGNPTAKTPLDLSILDRLTAGSLVLLEHPEHRLHSSLASQLGGAIVDAANRGVQIILETHSDHLLNGIRVGVHGGRIKPEDVGFHHFRTVDGSAGRKIEVVSPQIDRNGRIDLWVDGFFDQYEKHLEQLLC